MSLGRQIPLGQRIPASLHAVSASIPTMNDVIGYEEKRPETMALLTSGYPRFVAHEFLVEIAAHWQTLFNSPDASIWLASSERMAKRLQEHLDPVDTKFLRHRGVCGLRIPNDPDANREAKLFLQHVGGFLSSRQAEDYLIAEGLCDKPYSEHTYDGDSASQIRAFLGPLLGSPPDDVILTNTGMNAFFAAFEAVREIQSVNGRHSWIKLGWLYSDTMQILDKLSGDDADNLELVDVFDLDSLELELKKRGDSFAGIVMEAPCNPLIQTADLPRIRELATEYGVYLIVDPTVCSPLNIDVAPYSDIIVNSLTKYAASDGDLMLGAIAATEMCPDRENFLTLARSSVETPYRRDLARLAYQLSDYEMVIAKGNANTLAVVSYLENHPKIKRVYWAKEKSSRASFETIARHPDAVGSLISFEYDGPVAEFYDRVALPKGPSFGMKTSLLCPYVYLAHYALVTSESGREQLANGGISPELLRFGIGIEPAEEIIAALDAALGAAQ